MKVLNENLRRESELSLSKEKESLTLHSENTTLKSLLTDLRTQSSTFKED